MSNWETFAQRETRFFTRAPNYKWRNYLARRHHNWLVVWSNRLIWSTIAHGSWSFEMVLSYSLANAIKYEFPRSVKLREERLLNGTSEAKVYFQFGTTVKLNSSIGCNADSNWPLSSLRSSKQRKRNGNTPEATLFNIKRQARLFGTVDMNKARRCS